MMVQAAPAPTRSSKAATTSANRARPEKKTVLDTMYGRIKNARKTIQRIHEEAGLFQIREAADSPARRMLADLVAALDIDKGMAKAEKACESLAGQSWEPKGAVTRATFQVGQKVRIQEAKQAHFLRHGLYDATVIGAVAKVMKVAGAQAVIQLKDGSIISPIGSNWIEAVEASE